jgi:hypothetical protein
MNAHIKSVTPAETRLFVRNDLFIMRPDFDGAPATLNDAINSLRPIASKTIIAIYAISGKAVRVAEMIFL